MGNGFPGLAVFSLIALLVALGIAALAILQPWDEDSVAPRLSVAPGIGIGLADAVPVPREQRFAVASARPAPIAPSVIAATALPEEGDAPEPAPSIASARVVVQAAPSHPATNAPVSHPAQPPVEPQAPAPVSTPVSAPSPSPAGAPVAEAPARPVPGGGSPGPVTSGGPGPEPILIEDGDELSYSFPFYIQPSVYRAPGEDNLIVQFRDEASESHSFGLQLWDDGNGTQRGLWSSGDAMGGERFLAPLAEGVWHQLVILFEASSDGDGLYLLLLDGEPIDVRAWVSLIDPEGDSTLLDLGLFREGEHVTDTPDIFFGTAQLSETLEPVIP